MDWFWHTKQRSCFESARARASSFGSPSISSGVTAKVGVVPTVSNVVVIGAIIIAVKKTLKPTASRSGLVGINDR
jgi:hypothetical protein